MYQVGSRGISIHALREEGDGSSKLRPVSSFLFLSTPSARRATLQKRGFKRRMVISIHALREEGDAGACMEREGQEDFYPRPPRGGRQSATRFPVRGVTIFLSAPSARRATRPFGVAVDDQIISIHALREEGDSSAHRLTHVQRTISIHALREEGDFLRLTAGALLDAFLSTPSAKRATISVSRTARRSADFYPRPPRGGRPIQLDAVDMVIGISIHALREEGDTTGKVDTPEFKIFLSTPSARRATNRIAF